MSDWSEGVFDGGAAEVAAAVNWYGDVLAGYTGNAQAQEFGIGYVPQVLSTVSNWTSAEGGQAYQGGEAADIKSPLAAAKTEKSGVSRWWSGLSNDDKKMGITVATLLAGGLANVGAGRRKDRELSILESRATADTEFNRARIALEQQKMANASAIGQTNFGGAMAPGMINAPVNLTRNRLRPTPGVPA